MLLRSPEYFGDDQFRAVKKKMDSDYNSNINLWTVFWTEATYDNRLESGDTSMMGQFNSTLQNIDGRSNIFFNRTRPLLSLVSGHQRKNRKSVVVLPLENGDQQTADQWSKILLGIFKRENVYETISNAFYQGSLVSGMSLLQVINDYTNDPVSGDVKVCLRTYNQIMIDPYFRNMDLSDASFVRTRSYVSHLQAGILLPQYYEEIMKLQGNPTGMSKDSYFMYMPEAQGRSQENRLAYDEYYYRSFREQKLLIDKVTGDTLDVTNKDTLDIDRFLAENPQVKLIKQNIPTVRLAIAIQDKVFYDGPHPLGIDDYGFIPVMGYYNPTLPYFYSRIQGLCRSMRDPQILLNRRIVLSADLLESQLNSGWIFKENAPVDVKHLFQTGQGRVIPIKDEYQIADIQPITPPQVPPSFFQMQETFAKELNLCTGINEELIGSADDDKAGILSMLRQGAGLTTLQPLFDNLDQACVRLGECIMKVVQANYTPGKIKKILEGEEPAPLFYNKAFGKYHCAVELGLNTDTQKQMQAAQLLQYRQMGVQIPDEWLIDSLPIQNKSELLKKMEQQAQQQAQLQQQQIQAQLQLQQSQAQLAQARAYADKGLGAERLSRINENQALAEERKAEAVKDDFQALLNFVKAIKELDSIDLTQLQTIFQLQSMLKEPQQEPQYGQRVADLLARGQ